MLKIFSVSCYSTNGNHFRPYLKSVTLLAENKEDALKFLKEKFEKEGGGFIYPEDKWVIDCLVENLEPGLIIDYDESNDY